MSTSTRRLGLGAVVFVLIGPPVLLADLRRLQGLGLLAGRGTSADAAPELNRSFGADGPAEGAGQAPWAKRDFFAELDAVRQDGGWLEHPEIAAKYDVSFLAGWARYDHWAWDAAEPYLAALTEGEPCPLTAAIPNYLPATSIARVRLAQGLAAGDLGPVPLVPGFDI